MHIWDLAAPTSIENDISNRLGAISRWTIWKDTNQSQSVSIGFDFLKEEILRRFIAARPGYLKRTLNFHIRYFPNLISAQLSGNYQSLQRHIEIKPKFSTRFQRSGNKFRCLTYCGRTAFQRKTVGIRLECMRWRTKWLRKETDRRHSLNFLPLVMHGRLISKTANISANSSTAKNSCSLSISRVHPELSFHFFKTLEWEEWMSRWIWRAWSECTWIAAAGVRAGSVTGSRAVISAAANWTTTFSSG